MCEKATLEVNPRIWQLTGYASSPFELHAAQPLATLNCMTCSHVILVNLIGTGVLAKGDLERRQQEQPAAAKEGGDE